jgi:protein-S-isoprenylcysteine O-methyltransferase Ste14
MTVAQRPARRALPPVFLAAALVAIMVAHFLLPLARLIVFPMTLVGLLPLGGGIALNLLGDRAFKTHGTTVKPFERSSLLVTDGAFALSRNPMYLGMVLFLLGVALLLGSLTPLIVVPAFWLLLDRRFVTLEERMLGQTFGAEFDAYRGRVRRWL